MAQSAAQKPKRKLVRNAALVILVLIGIAIIISGMQNRKQSAVPDNQSTQLPAISSQPTKPVEPSSSGNGNNQTGGGNSRSGSKSLNLKAQAAVSAAVLADANLTLSQFQTASQRRLIINATVLPALRHRFNLAYKYTGLVLALKAFGYGSIEEARNLADYRITTMMYRVDQLTRERAKISLFDFTSFRTHDDLTTGLQHKDVGITILTMRKVAGKWLLASSSDGPGPHYSKGQTVKFQEKLAAYQPFLKGFTRYGNA